LNAGTGADNVIPGTLEAVFNFRFGSASTPQELRARLESVLRRHGLDYQIDWRQSGTPFLTVDGPLRRAVCAVLLEQARHQARAEHRRRHLGRTLHRPAGRRGSGAGPAQRQHPQGR
ncbi:succinyl-diaminopimelate desuccinylase, partial [mine drainage metagenome]